MNTRLSKEINGIIFYSQTPMVSILLLQMFYYQTKEYKNFKKRNTHYSLFCCSVKHTEFYSLVPKLLDNIYMDITQRMEVDPGPPMDLQDLPVLRELLRRIVEFYPECYSNVSKFCILPKINFNYFPERLSQSFKSGIEELLIKLSVNDDAMLYDKLLHVIPHLNAEQCFQTCETVIKTLQNEVVYKTNHPDENVPRNRNYLCADIIALATPEQKKTMQQLVWKLLDKQFMQRLLNDNPEDKTEQDKLNDFSFRDNPESRIRLQATHQVEIEFLRLLAKGDDLEQRKFFAYLLSEFKQTIYSSSHRGFISNGTEVPRTVYTILIEQLSLLLLDCSDSLQIEIKKFFLHCKLQMDGAYSSYTDSQYTSEYSKREEVNEMINGLFLESMQCTNIAYDNKLKYVLSEEFRDLMLIPLFLSQKQYYEENQVPLSARLIALILELTSTGVCRNDGSRRYLPQVESACNDLLLLDYQRLDETAREKFVTLLMENHYFFWYGGDKFLADIYDGLSERSKSKITEHCRYQQIPLFEKILAGADEEQKKIMYEKLDKEVRDYDFHVYLEKFKALIKPELAIASLKKLMTKFKEQTKILEYFKFRPDHFWQTNLPVHLAIFPNMNKEEQDYIISFYSLAAINLSARRHFVDLDDYGKLMQLANREQRLTMLGFIPQMFLAKNHLAPEKLVARMNTEDSYILLRDIYIKNENKPLRLSPLASLLTEKLSIHEALKEHDLPEDIINLTNSYRLG